MTDTVGDSEPHKKKLYFSYVSPTMEDKKETPKLKEPKKPPSKYKELDFWDWMPRILYLVATLLNVSAALSLPLTPSSYTCICEVDFNPEIFNGTLNGIPVTDLGAIRVSLN